MNPVPGFLTRMPTYSYTFLHTYKNVCPHQAERRYIRRDIPYVETPQIKWGNEVHAAFEYRVGGGKPLPASMQQWEGFARPFDGKNARTELKLGVTAEGHACDFFAKNVWLRGKADAVITSGTTAYFADFKTGSSKYVDRFELDVQAVLLHASQPGLTKIVGQYIFLKEDRVGTMYDLSDTRATWGAIADIARQIEADKASGHFEKRQGPLCGWCPVKDCEFNRNTNNA